MTKSRQPRIMTQKSPEDQKVLRAFLCHNMLGRISRDGSLVIVAQSAILGDIVTGFVDMIFVVATPAAEQDLAVL